MSRFAWVGSPALLLLLAVACSTETTGPSTGSLAVVVLGLPTGGSADLTIAGPDGFSQSLSASQTLSGLTPGSYSVAASAVNVGSASYAPAPASQSVTVTRSEVAASVNVLYGASGGNLTVVVNGLPSGAAAPVMVTGPGGYSQPIPETRTLSLLPVGTYTITAESVDAGCSQYTPSAATQSVAVDLSSPASAEVSYGAPASGGFNLCINGMYLTQSVQTYAGTVPLVKDRDGYLRVFVTANEINAARPVVRATFYSNGSLVDTKIINAPLGMLGTPQAPDESSLNSSWNVPVSETLIQPNLSVLIELDPDNAITEASEGDNVFPATGVPLPLNVVTTSPFDVTLVPVLQSVNGRLGDVTEINKDEYLATTMKMHPLPGYNVIVRAQPFTTDQAAVEAENGNNAWNVILAELDALRVEEGGSRHYYGVVNTTYTSGVAGVGYVGRPTALGWDRLPSASSVAAHEWGHNWKRNHAPCGGAGQLDTGYPYSGGTIGVFGFDLESATIKPTYSHDLMGYCPDEWISDYTYRGVLNFRSSAAVSAARMDQAVQPALLVWGRIENGVPVLEPAFQVTTRPTLPSASGPYTLEGRAEDGSAVFGISFAPTEVADARNGSQHFAFTVPMSPAKAARVATLRLAGRGRETSMSRSSVTPATVEVRPTTSGRVALTWDASRTPMVMVRDAATGQILSFARGGHAEIRTDRRDLSLTLSNRVQSRDVRVSVPAR
ncbi:MAG: hypothetical protein H0T44_02580 [Gemmatimonadales bacterium]|nr:hypothetical protein [Gemmatimonadales bacterium]